MREADDDFFSVFEKATEKSVFISHGTAKGRISLKADGERLYVVVEGQPRGEYLLRCFREGLDEGVVRPNMRTLVDLRGLTGGTDWSPVFTLRTYAPWGHGKEGVSSTAYLLRSDLFGAMVKIAETLFFGTHHRSFHDPAEAVAWLKTMAKPPG